MKKATIFLLATILLNLIGALTVMRGLWGSDLYSLSYAITYQKTQLPLWGIAYFVFLKKDPCKDEKHTSALSEIIVLGSSDEHDIDDLKKLASNLLEKGCDINKKDKNGLTPLNNLLLDLKLRKEENKNDLAVRRVQEITAFLIRNGADPKVPIAQDGKFSGLNSLDIASNLCEENKCIQIK